MNAVEVKEVSKTFRLYGKPADRLKEAVLRRPFHQPFECLQEVSFAVPIGESFGIIGENGAGKSTLLKMLAGTLTPTSGEVITRGRVAALLELGAGFHTEFTGRQNIFLNASLLGLSHLEIEEKEPDIIEFAELGTFIDRPIKIYSSGMVVRLAFSIATSINPDILIIDEALSVGDQYFQKKCVDKMVGFQEFGKTILFCSHSMHLVNLLCKRAVWLDNGVVRNIGPTARVIADYENYLREKSAIKNAERALAENAESRKTPILIRSLQLNGTGGPVTLEYRQDLDVLLEFESFDEKPFWVAMGIRRNDDLICHAVKMSSDNGRPLRGRGVGKIHLTYRSLPLLHGKYFVVCSILDESRLHCYHQKESSALTIIPPEKWDEELGLLDLEHEWHIVKELE